MNVKKKETAEDVKVFALLMCVELITKHTEITARDNVQGLIFKIKENVKIKLVTIIKKKFAEVTKKLILMNVLHCNQVFKFCTMVDVSKKNYANV